MTETLGKPAPTLKVKDKKVLSKKEQAYLKGLEIAHSANKITRQGPINRPR